jgi:carboxyl-terminal processing protease
MRYKRVLFYYIIFFLGASLSFGFGYIIRSIQDEYHGSEFPILSQAYNILYNHGYMEISDGQMLEYSMIRGMVEAYGDPFTRFEEPAQHEITTDELSGRYAGIGASLEYDMNGMIILHPFPEGPAEEAGVLDGDQLIQVDDLENLPSMSLDTVVAALRGPEGEWVSIKIIRPPNMETKEFRIRRKDIPLPSVTWFLDSENQWSGIIRVNLITANTSNEILNAFQDLTSRGATHFILDLRDNRGGLLASGIDIAKLFLKDGVIIEEQYRSQKIRSYEAKNPGPLIDFPLVVIVNSNTASAAEIIAGALQGNHRAKIIGTHTFGKDSIQLVFDLKDGSSLHVTAAKWWIPSLRYDLGDSGLQPDIAVDNEDQVLGDLFIQTAIKSFQNEQ